MRWTFEQWMSSSSNFETILAHLCSVNLFWYLFAATCKELIICVWVVVATGDSQKFTVKVPHNTTPVDVVAAVITKRTKSMQISPVHSQQQIFPSDGVKVQDNGFYSLCTFCQGPLGPCLIISNKEWKIRISNLFCRTNRKRAQRSTRGRTFWGFAGRISSYWPTVTWVSTR